MEAKDKDMDQNHTETMPEQAEDGLAEPDDGSYPPDSDYEGLGDPDDLPDIDASTGPGNVPVPRAAAIRKQALKNKAPISPSRAKKMKKRSTRILAQQKRRQAVELRKAGVVYADIATMVGYSDASAARKSVLKGLEDIIQEPVAELRVMQIERLNYMLVALWNKVKAGDESAINTSLRVMQQLDSLMGTEAAKEINVHQSHSGAVLVIDGSKDDYIRSLRQMSGVGIQADGTNAPRAIGGPPPGMRANAQAGDEPVDDVIDADVVEDDGDAPLTAPQPDRVVIGPDAAITPQKTKKKFSFGVEPTVKKGSR